MRASEYALQAYWIEELLYSRLSHDEQGNKSHDAELPRLHIVAYILIFVNGKKGLCKGKKERKSARILVENRVFLYAKKCLENRKRIDHASFGVAFGAGSGLGGGGKYS